MIINNNTPRRNRALPKLSPQMCCIPRTNFFIGFLTVGIATKGSIDSRTFNFLRRYGIQTNRCSQGSRDRFTYPIACHACSYNLIHNGTMQSCLRCLESCYFSRLDLVVIFLPLSNAYAAWFANHIFIVHIFVNKFYSLPVLDRAKY